MTIIEVQRPFDAVLFDLDGTLVDTLPDIAAAMNAALSELGMIESTQATIGTFIGRGPRALAERLLLQQSTLDADARAGLIDTLLNAYLRRYSSLIGEFGRIFPGVIDGMRELKQQGIKIGVVTNAEHEIAENILARFDIAPLVDILVGGTPSIPHKPHPASLLIACHALDVMPQATLMVGDSINDVGAARAAQCAIVAVPYGYNGGEDASTLGCDIVEDLSQLSAWIAQSGVRQIPATHSSQ